MIPLRTVRNRVASGRVRSAMAKLEIPQRLARSRLSLSIGRAPSSYQCLKNMENVKLSPYSSCVCQLSLCSKPTLYSIIPKSVPFGPSTAESPMLIAIKASSSSAKIICAEAGDGFARSSGCTEIPNAYKQSRISLESIVGKANSSVGGGPLRCCDIAVAVGR